MNTRWLRFMVCSVLSIFDIILGVVAQNTLRNHALAELFFWSGFLLAVGALASYMAMRENDD